MSRFQKIYEIPFFGAEWGHESAHDEFKKAAYQTLLDVLKRTYSEDMRTRDVLDAVDYLRSYSARQAAFDDFVKALDIPDSTRRLEKVYGAMMGIRRYLLS